MRIWRDADGSMLTDEQLLRHIATFGSLSAACEQGDIALLSRGGERPIAKPGNREKKSRLSDYLGTV